MSNAIKLAVKCPACSHTRLQTLRQIKAQSTFVCHDCGYQAPLALAPGKPAPGHKTQHAAKQREAELADAV